MSNRRQSIYGGLACLAGAGILLASTRITWLKVESSDHLAGNSSLSIHGGAWSTEATAVALLLLASAIAIFALRRLGRRIVSVVAGLAAVGASWTPVMVLAVEPDYGRIHRILSTGQITQRGGDPLTISAWSEITGVEVNALGPVVALLGCAIALFGAILVIVRPGQDAVALNKYERKAQREVKLEEDMAARPDSGRVMWDALDADIDPTEHPTKGD